MVAVFGGVEVLGEAVAAEGHPDRHRDRLLLNHQIHWEDTLAQVRKGVDLSFKGFVGEVAHSVCR